MLWALVVYFSCPIAIAPCYPTQFTVRYATQAECIAAGKTWLLPAANPTKTVRSYKCELRTR